MALSAFAYREKDSTASKIEPLSLFISFIALSIGISISSKVTLLIYALSVVLLELPTKTNLIKSLIKTPSMMIVPIIILLFSLLSDKSLDESIFLALRFLVIIALSFEFLESAEPYEISNSIGLISSRVLGKTAWRISSYTLLALRLMPILGTSFSNAMKAFRSRGGRFFPHTIKAISLLISLFMKRAINLAIDLDDAMRSRMYLIDTPNRCRRLSLSDILTPICVILTVIFLSLKRRLF